ncbi:MAG: nucleoside hydrolase [Candidatus Gracilibacteria bacterium]
MINTHTAKVPQILIDCDPGTDDFFALLWALGLHKKGFIQIHAITTTGGNVGPELTYLNALRACDFMGITDISIGCSALISPSANASHIHGKDGLGDASQFLQKIKVPKKPLSSADLIEKTLKKYPETQILCFGPMTNMAKYLDKNTYTGRVIAMGGAFQVSGNVTPVAEFNISYDPESADTVLSHVNNTVLLPLDVTSQLIFTRREMKSIITKLPKKKAKFLEALTLHTFETNMAFRETAGLEGFLVHDASVVAMLVYPHLFSGQFLPVRVETKGEYTRGQTVTDLRNIAQPSTHTFVVKNVDGDRFMEAMVQDFLSFL